MRISDVIQIDGDNNSKMNKWVNLLLLIALVFLIVAILKETASVFS